MFSFEPHTHYVPPFHHMGLVVPVLPRPLCVYIRVNSRAAWDRAGHIIHRMFSGSPGTEKIDTIKTNMIGGVYVRQHRTLMSVFCYLIYFTSR